MPTLYVIDGYAAFFRCFHAIRTAMTSPVTKEPTNMTFGFVGMLLKLLRADGVNLAKVGGNPDYIAVALDVGGDRGTFRSQIYPPYKANRSEPPAELAPQVDRCLAMLKAVGIPVIASPGFEADDVMATMVEQFSHTHPDLAIRLISKDKDLKQLLDGDRVILFDIHTDAPFTERTLIAELGITPSLVIDYLCLVGDSSDNVPGVDGVGEKTAVQLMKDYGDINGILANIDKVKGKRQENLKAFVPKLDLTRTLIRLRRDAPIQFDLDSARVPHFKLAEMIPVLKELGFNRYQDEVRSLLGLSRPTAGTRASAGPGPSGSSPTRSGVAVASAANAKPRSKRGPDALAGGLFDSPAAPPSAELGIAALASGTAITEPRDIAVESTISGAPVNLFIKAENGSYKAITTKDHLATLRAVLATSPVIAIDTETTALSPHSARLCGISIAVTPGEAFYVPTLSPTPDAHLTQADVLAVLGPILEDARIAKCGHNLKFDINIFRAAGITLRGLTTIGGCDSMIASYLIDASRSSHSLDALSLALLNRSNISLSQLVGSGKSMRTFNTISVAQAAEYAAEDADAALQLRNIFLPQIESLNMGPLAHDVEFPLVEVLAEMEYNGIIVDPIELETQRSRLAAQIETLRRDIDAEARSKLGRTFDPDSPKQLAAALFGKPDDDLPGLGIKGTKRTKTGFSTDAEVLEELAADDSITTPLPGLILEYRQLTKLVSTYLVALKDAIHPITRRIHTSFSQTVAATGRLASSDPNLQNIPIRTDVGRDIRRAFIAPPGHVLITADYSQIELRLLAHLSRDPALIAAFEHDEDIHTAVAAQIHGIDPSAVTREQRSGAKMVNFGIVYGITAFGLARRLKISKEAAASIIDGYKRKFSGITTFLQECIEQARSQGYVETMLRRRRPVPDANADIPARRALGERLAINSVVQGSAADLIKIAMVRLHQRILDGRNDPSHPLHGTRMLLQIHDELVFETPAERADAALPIIVDGMEQAMKLSVPIRVDGHIASTWFGGKG